MPPQGSSDKGVPNVEQVRAILAEAGLTASVEERTLALTASADGGMLIGIFIGVPLPEFAKLVVDDAYLGVKNLLSRFRQRGGVHYVVYAGEEGVDARIDSDLPPEAFLKLQGSLPSLAFWTYHLQPRCKALARLRER